MQIETLIVLTYAIYKISCLLTGLILSYMGYRLFMNGITSNAGSLSGDSEGKHFELKDAAPGTFFAVFGAIVICFTTFTKLELTSDTPQTSKAQTIESGSDTDKLPEKTN